MDGQTKKVNNHRYTVVSYELVPGHIATSNSADDRHGDDGDGTACHHPDEQNQHQQKQQERRYSSSSPEAAAAELELAPTDLTHLVRHSSLPWALFYRDRLDHQRLREGLSHVLGHYVALAGRSPVTSPPPQLHRQRSAVKHPLWSAHVRGLMSHLL